MSIPVRVPADAVPALASERRMAANRGHPLDPYPCPVCDEPLGEQVTVLILAGIRPQDRRAAGATTGAAVQVHAACAGVPDEEPGVEKRLLEDAASFKQGAASLDEEGFISRTLANLGITPDTAIDNEIAPEEEP